MASRESLDLMEISETSPLKTAAQPTDRSSSAAGKVKESRQSLVPVVTEYKLGDIVWAHVQQYPWWPAVVAPDPKGGEFSQIKQSTGGGRQVMLQHYHVLFFGPSPEHNWVSIRHMMPFTGRVDYDKYMDDLKQRAAKSKSDKQFLKSISIKSHQQAAWDTALREGEEAIEEDNIDDRLERWITVFFEKAARRSTSRTPKKVENPEAEGGDVSGEGKAASSKRKRKPTESPKKELEDSLEVEPAKPPPIPEPAPATVTPAAATLPQKPAKKTNKKKVPLKTSSQADEDLLAMTQLPMEPLPENDPETQPEGSFHLFTQRNLRAVAMRYPTQSYAQLKTLLYNIWAKMTLNEKRKCLTTPVEKPPPPPTQEPEKEKKGKKEKQEKEKEKEKEAIDDEDADKPPLPAPLPPQVEEYKEALGSYQLEIYRLTNIWAVRNQPVCGICEKPGAELSENGTTSVTNHLNSPPHNSVPAATANQTVDDELVSCSGQCCRHFHKRCLTKMFELFGLPPFSATGTITCAECHLGRRTCFSCKKQDLSQNSENNLEEYSEEDKQMILCSVHRCGRFYHRICATKLRLSRFENNTFTCPQHACATCAAAVEDPTSAESSRSGKMFRCVRCPAAYHVGDFCIAAGTQILGSGPNIICGDHYEPTASLAMLSSGSVAAKTVAVSKPQHVTWCFTCGKSGPHSDDKQQAEAAQPVQPQGPPEKPLICCATCPAAYHRRCLPAAQAATSDQRFVCTDCNAGKRPLYGDIVWVKIGHYRWWPCEIYHPENLPPNIRKMKHGTGEFAVRFFGTGEFFWLGRGRCFHFQHGDTSAAPTSGHGSLARLYNNSIVEATTAFEEWTRFKERQMGTQRERANCKPVPFKYIKQNYPIGDVEMPKIDLSEIPKCDCDINQPNPCGSDSNCVNRLTQVECHPQVCNAGDQCCNQHFVKRLYAPAEPFRTASRGWGLRALAPIRRGQFVVEYVGDLIDEDEHRRRVDDATKSGETNFYFLTLDRYRIIDAGPKGNLSRFMNHSCQPSCETQKWLVNGDLRVGLFALRDIAAGEELTFNYNCDESNEDAILLDKQPCRCGALECRGLIGASKPPAGSNGSKNGKEGGKTANKLSRRSRQYQQLAAFRESHDDECFQCGEPGRLVLCDRPRCPKAYHVGCLGQDKPPSGRFICPWHYCSVCWKPSAQLCAFCPHSYCAEHAKSDKIVERMSFSMGPMWCCTGHDPNELNEVLGYPSAAEKS